MIIINKSILQKKNECLVFANVRRKPEKATFTAETKQ